MHAAIAGLVGLVGVVTAPALAQPANDTCATAESISINPGTAQVVGGDNRLAGNDPGIPACTLSSSGGSGTKGVWYTFVGTGNVVTLDTCGTARDLVLRVFCGPCGTLQCAASDDDGCDVFTTSSPRLSLCTTPGTTYTVLLSRFGGSTGAGIEFLMNVIDSGSPCPASAAPTCAAGVTAPNDACLNATPIAIGGSAVASTINATAETGIASSCGVSTANGVWFSFVGNGGNVVASTCSALTGANTRVLIFSGECGNLECVDGSTTTTTPCAARGDAASAAATCTVLGQTYYVLVSNDSNGSGFFELTLTGSPCVPPPVNDQCENALPLAPGSSALVDTTWATTDSSVSFIRQGVWYTYTPTTQVRVEFSTCDAATAVDTQINLFFGTCGPADPTGLTAIDGASDADPICDIRPDSAALSACLLPGRTYYLLVGGGQGATAGPIRVTATAAGPCGPANDTCAGAEALTLGASIDASSFDAADEVGATSCGAVAIQPLNNGIWYSYTHIGPAARVAATTCDNDPDQSNTFFDTAILVYSGTCGALVCQSANDDPAVACDDREDEAYADFCAQPGQTYLILLVNGSTAFDGGQFRISLVPASGDCTVPVGACCAGATCTVLNQPDCTGTGTRFGGAGTVCNAPGAGTSPCCRADFDQNGTRDVADIFGFLSAWFSASPTADADSSGIRDVADIFAFLSQWFAGC